MRRALLDGARANLEAGSRDGAIDRIHAPGNLLATGDLHDNPVHFNALMKAAGMTAETDNGAHLTLHELIHSDRLVDGMDFSYRMLARVAALKTAFPERVHTLLANHELAQVMGAGIVKDGVRCVDVFNDGVLDTFGDQSEVVTDAIGTFIRSMPLALRCHTPRGDILCAHSLPAPEAMGRFDATILDRPLTDDDYAPRKGSAYFMVWGRGYDHDQLEDLVERWGINLFILGHEHADSGVAFVPPNAIVLNSDHARGVYLPIDLDNPPSPMRALESVVSLSMPG